jgi:prephenate dehydratase
LPKELGPLPPSTKPLRVAFQGEPGAFSEAAAIQLLGPEITTVPRVTFDAVFRAIPENAADALLVPVENSLAGSVVRVYDLMLENHEDKLTITAETILPIELNLIAVPGASLDKIQTVSSHPMALAQCERFFARHPLFKRVPAEDTAGSVREVLGRGDRISAAIAGRRAADYYKGVILAEKIQDNSENFTRFVLLRRESDAAAIAPTADARKMSVAMQLAHRPGALLAALEPFARHNINLRKIESRPIHGQPWAYSFIIEIEADKPELLDAALAEARKSTDDLRVLGLYVAAKTDPAHSAARK